MTEVSEIYKCNVCGNIVEVLHSGEGELVCCGEPMKKMEAQTEDYKNEKHVPMIEKQDGGYMVIVGSTLHPMTEEHYIEWIELNADGKVYKKFLKPGDEPKAFFKVEASEVSAREYCNIHGLWKS
jgi:superoxide reductase